MGAIFIEVLSTFLTQLIGALLLQLTVLVWVIRLLLHLDVVVVCINAISTLIVCIKVQHFADSHLALCHLLSHFAISIMISTVTLLLGLRAWLAFWLRSILIGSVCCTYEDKRVSDIV